MQNKTINELTSLENPRLTDTLPIWDGTQGKTKKVSLAKIPANVITPVDSLPESPNILDRVYRYNNKYYVGNESAQTLTELALKADIPTVVDTVADGNMNPVTSNAVFDSLYLKGASATEILTVLRDTTVVGGTPYDYTTTATIPTDGWYKFQVQANMKDNPGILTNYVKLSIGTVEVVTVHTFTPEWNEKVNTVIIPVKAGTVVTYHAHCEAHAAGTNVTYRNFGSVHKIV